MTFDLSQTAGQLLLRSLLMCFHPDVLTNPHHYAPGQRWTRIRTSDPEWTDFCFWTLVWIQQQHDEWRHIFLFFWGHFSIVIRSLQSESSDSVHLSHSVKCESEDGSADRMKTHKDLGEGPGWRLQGVGERVRRWRPTLKWPTRTQSRSLFWSSSHSAASFNSKNPNKPDSWRTGLIPQDLKGQLDPRAAAGSSVLDVGSVVVSSVFL